MATKRVITSELLIDGAYEVSMLTKEDNKSFYFKFVTDIFRKKDVIWVIRKIKEVLEELTDCYVLQVKPVYKFKEKIIDVDGDRGASFSGIYLLDKVPVKTNTLFLPYVKKKYIEMDTLEIQLRKIFGEKFRISDYSPR